MEVDTPLPDLAAPVSTSPDPLPAEELPRRGEGGGRRDGGQSSGSPMELSSLLRTRGGDHHAQSVGYELGLQEAMDLMRDEEEEERSLMLQTGSWSAKEV